MSRWDTATVAFFGTSLTSINYGGYWQNNLRETLPPLVNKEFRLFDFGMPGQTCAGGQSQLPRMLNLRPSIIVVEFAMNDAYTANGITLASFKTSLATMVDTIVAALPSSQLKLMTMNPAISPGAATVPNLATYYQGVRDIAAAKSIGLIDLTPLWGTPTSLQIPVDGIHPTGAAFVSVALPTLTTAIASAINL
jgi:lysophospholipase L1-like esterase